jgi:hypothetical protein
MGDVVILGAYPDGLETDDLTQFPDRWTCWRFKSSSPREIWREPAPLLRAIIRQLSKYLSPKKFLFMDFSKKTQAGWHWRGSCSKIGGGDVKVQYIC